MDRDKGAFRKSGSRDPPRRPGQLQRVQVEAVEAASRLYGLDDLQGVAAVAQSRVDRRLARLRREDGHDLGDENGAMAARGRVPPREHTLDILAILLGVVLLVLLREGAGMAAPVALAAKV